MNPALLPIVASAIRHCLTFFGLTEVVGDGGNAVAGAVCVLIGFGWSVWRAFANKKNPPPASPPPAVGVTLLLVTLAAGLSGCAHFSTTQKDERIGDATTITTKAQATTLFSARSALANFKATQTEKSQGAEVGSLNQQGGTNTAATVEAVTRLLQTLKP